jgi:hypothetical protein
MKYFRRSVGYKNVAANFAAGSINIYFPDRVTVSYNPKEISTFYVNYLLTVGYTLLIMLIHWQFSTICHLYNLQFTAAVFHHELPS